ncbi:protein kinase [Streptomyces sp. NPDC058690]|uniref:protein kinase domain-containing protein n=1 Tax=Streptomyces sp. NPDC058690 TaxID=3346600 RepID=UPI00364F38CF
MHGGSPDSAAWEVGGLVDGRYQIKQIHRTGGMGLVYRVRHVEWGIDLAVKCPRPELFQRVGDRDRFTAEAETWVALGMHPNICCCHYVRVLDDVPRVFAEYVAGGSLRDWIDDRRLYQGDGLARILDVSIQTAWGLEYAHARGLVHRDMKPANVLLDEDGTAKVTDFGLARAAAALLGAEASAAGTVLVPGGGGMTPAYASPEQASRLPLDRRSDIYSFAVSVLDMLTGGVSWDRGSQAGRVLAARRACGSAAPGFPSIPDNVAGLLERCLRQDPAQRPRSMAEVASALIEIYRIAVGHKYVRPAPSAADLRADEFNNRALSLLDLGRSGEAGKAFRKALAVDPRHLESTYNAGLALWRRGAATDEQVVVGVDAVRADAAESWLGRYLLAQVQMERGDLDAAETLLADAGRDGPTGSEFEVAAAALGSRRLAGIRGAEVLKLPWRETGDKLFQRDIPTAFSDDGCSALIGSDDGLVRLVDARDGRVVRTLEGADKATQSAAISGDGSVAAASDEDGVVRIWDLASGRRMHEFAPDPHWSFPLPLLEPYPLELSRDGSILLWPNPQGSVQIRDLRGGKPLRSLPNHDYRVRSIAVSADGRHSLTCDGYYSEGSDYRLRRWDVAAGYRVRWWDVATGRSLGTLASLDLWASALSFDANGGIAVIASRDIQIWDLAGRRCLQTLSGHSELVDSVSLTPDGRFLLSGGKDRTVRLWDVSSGRCLRTLRGHTGSLSAVWMAPDARYARSIGQGGELRSWTVEDGQSFAAVFQVSKPRRFTELDDLAGRVDALVRQAEGEIRAGRRAAALDLLRQARATPGYERAPEVLTLWREIGRTATHVGLRAAHHVKTLTSGIVFALDLTPDGRTALTGILQEHFQIWDVESGVCRRTITDDRLPPGPAELSADSRFILHRAGDWTVVLWAASTGRLLWVLDRDEGTVVAKFAANGRHVICGQKDGRLRIWDPADGRCVREIAAHTAMAAVLAVGADGRLIASAAKNSVKLWDVQNGRCLATLQGHINLVTSLHLSADCRHLVSAGGEDDRQIRLWDVATGSCLRIFEDQPGFAQAVQFTADGRFVVSGGSDATVRIWDVATGRCLRVLEGHTDTVYRVVVSADGRHLLSAGKDVRLWELDWELELPGTGPEGRAVRWLRRLKPSKPTR